MRSGMVDSHGPVRKAVLDKASKYGRLDAPYIVAVNAPDVDDRIDEMQALFGAEQFVFDPSRFDDPPAMSRAPNGVWVNEGYVPRSTRVGAVLIFRGVTPWNLSAPTCLYVNPYTPVTLPMQLFQLPYAMSDSTDHMTWHEGRTPTSILGLTEDWRDTDLSTGETT